MCWLPASQGEESRLWLYDVWWSPASKLFEHLNQPWVLSTFEKTVWILWCDILGSGFCGAHKTVIQVLLINLQSFIRWMETALPQTAEKMQETKTVWPQAACRKEVRSLMAAQYTRKRLWSCNTPTLASAFYVQCPIDKCSQHQNRSWT